MDPSGGGGRLGNILVQIDGDNAKLRQKLAESNTLAKAHAGVIDNQVKRSSAAFQRLGTDVQKFNTGFLAGFKANEKAVENLGMRVGKIASFLTNPYVLGAAAVVGFGVALKKAMTVSAHFEKEFANVTTLFDSSVVDVVALRKGIQGLDAELGKSADLAKAAYQAISAGIAPAQTVEAIEKAAKFATAALVDQFTAIDVGTTVINAYGLRIEELEDVYDTLFKTIEQGKTTGIELSSSFGTVIPFAAELEIELTELSAAIAAMTKGGISTDIAVTALRQTLATFLSPTAGAKKMAEELGVELSAASMKSKGLMGSLKELALASRGNAEAISTFFGNIRSLTAVLSLTGKQASEFERILQVMESRVGAVDTAFKKQTDTLEHQKEVLGTVITKWQEFFGEDAANIYKQTLHIINTQLEKTIENARELRDETPFPAWIAGLAALAQAAPSLPLRAMGYAYEGVGKAAQFALDKIHGVTAEDRAAVHAQEALMRELAERSAVLEDFYGNNIIDLKGFTALTEKQMEALSKIRAANQKAELELQYEGFALKREILEQELILLQDTLGEHVDLKKYAALQYALIDEAELAEKLKLQKKGVEDAKKAQEEELAAKKWAVDNWIALEKQRSDAYKKSLEDQLAASLESVTKQQELDRYYQTGNLAAYMTALDQETAAKISQLAGLQEYMQVYQDMMIEANRSMYSYIAEAAGTFYQVATAGLMDMIFAGKNAQEVIKGLGIAMVRMVAQFIVQRIIASVVSKALWAAEAVVIGGIASAIAAMWAPAAALASLATLGGNAAPAAAALTGTVALAQALAVGSGATGGAGGLTMSTGTGMINLEGLKLGGGTAEGISTAGMSLEGLPSFGEGGLVTKPTIALIGEKGPEWVIPDVGRPPSTLPPIIIKSEVRNYGNLVHPIDVDAIASAVDTKIGESLRVRLLGR